MGEQKDWTKHFQKKAERNKRTPEEVKKMHQDWIDNRDKTCEAIAQAIVKQIKRRDKMASNLELYEPHIFKGGGRPPGFKFMECPSCHKHGVSSRIIGKALIRKACQYCGWVEGSHKP